MVGVDQKRDVSVKSVGKEFGNTFDRAILEGDGAKVIWGPGVIILREKNNEGSVEAGDVRTQGMKISKEALQRLASLPGLAGYTGP